MLVSALTLILKLYTGATQALTGGREICLVRLDYIIAHYYLFFLFFPYDIKPFCLFMVVQIRKYSLIED